MGKGTKFSEKQTNRAHRAISAGAISPRVPLDRKAAEKCETEHCSSIWPIGPIRLISPIRPIGHPPLTLILPIIPPCLAHPLAQPAKLDEILLQPPDLPVQEKVALVHQTDHNVGADDAVPRFQELAVGFK